jgi:uncharacterized protein
MPEYLAPGVFVEEVSYRAKSIEGVSTTTTGFVGPTRYGPLDLEPEVITSLVEFERTYGGRQPLEFSDAGNAVDNYIWNAVRAFFEEGGKRVYVARVFDVAGEDDDDREAAFLNAHAQMEIAFPPPNLAFRARYPGQAGDCSVRLMLNLSQNRIAFDDDGDAALRACADFDVVYANLTANGTARDGPYSIVRDPQTGDWTFTDIANATFRLSDVANTLDVDGRPTAIVKTLTATVYVEPSSEGLPFFAATSLALDSRHRAFGMPDSIFDYFAAERENPASARNIPIVVEELNGEQANAAVTAAQAELAAARIIGAATALIDAITKAEEDLAISDTATNRTALKKAQDDLLDNHTGKRNTALVDRDTAVTALAGSDTATNRNKLAKAEKDLVEAQANLDRHLRAKAVLVVANAALARVGAATPITGLQLASNFLSATTMDDRVTLAALLENSGDGAVVDANYILSGGDDGRIPTTIAYMGETDPDTDRKTGLVAMEDVEDISIIAAPGSSMTIANAQGVANALISHAQRMRYRIAVIDSIKNQSISETRDYRAKFDSKYAAFYYPWVRVVDPVTTLENHYPPSGFVAGIYARNDIERAVYKAPANEVVNLAVGFEKFINKGQQEVLNPEGINCFRFFEGRGMRLWGARTMTSDPEWKYVNLRRYFAFLERSIDKGTQWAVFEPNGDKLWANVRRTIEDFLLNEWQNGALLGEKPERAFFVKCDRSTMTQNDIDNGRLVCNVGVAALKPAEFVIFRIGQWTANATR